MALAARSSPMFGNQMAGSAPAQAAPCPPGTRRVSGEEWIAVALVLSLRRSGDPYVPVPRSRILRARMAHDGRCHAAAMRPHDLGFRAPGRSRTRNLVGRSHPLCPVELRGRAWSCRPTHSSTRVPPSTWNPVMDDSGGVPCCVGCSPMVAVAQLVRAPGCGPGGRGFKSPRSPS